MAPERTTRAVVTTATMAATASDHAIAPVRNGNWPPCGNSHRGDRRPAPPPARRARPAGAAARAATTRQGERQHHAGDRAGRCRGDDEHGGEPFGGADAASAARPTASPRANVSRPTATLTTVPAANSGLAVTPAGRAATRSWKQQAAITQLSDRDGVRSDDAPSTGNSTPYAGRVVTGEPQGVPDRRARRRPARPGAAAPASRRRASRGRPRGRRARRPARRA